MTLEEQIAHQLSKQVSKRIDNELLIEVLTSIGWTKVKYKPVISSEGAVDCQDWMIETCKGPFKRIGLYFLFENQEDAVMYTLKWS